MNLLPISKPLALQIAVEKFVFAELCDLVEATIALYKKEGRPLPPPTSGKDYANLLQSTG